MTMNNSKKYGIVLLINIGLLVFFIFSCYLYNHRQVLMDTTFYYEIPVIDKVLTINTPVFNDYAYVRIETNKSYTLKKCADLKIVRRETTDVSLIFNKQKNDTIFYSDRWGDVILLDKKHIYKKVRWYDDRFYVKDNKTKRYYIRNNFIEVVIKDNATFVVYQSNKLFRVLKTFVLRSTKVEQWLFLCGQQPSASSPVTHSFICTFLVRTKIFSSTVPTAPMPSKHSISAARSSHSTIYTQLRLVE